MLQQIKFYPSKIFEFDSGWFKGYFRDQFAVNFVDGILGATLVLRDH